MAIKVLGGCHGYIKKLYEAVFDAQTYRLEEGLLKIAQNAHKGFLNMPKFFFLGINRSNVKLEETKTSERYWGIQSRRIK